MKHLYATLAALVLSTCLPAMGQPQEKIFRLLTWTDRKSTRLNSSHG